MALKTRTVGISTRRLNLRAGFAQIRFIMQTDSNLRAVDALNVTAVFSTFYHKRFNMNKLIERLEKLDA